jgi:hypothetical protein
MRVMDLGNKFHANALAAGGWTSWHHSDLKSPVFVSFLGNEKCKDGGAMYIPALLAQPEVKN